MIMIRYIPVVMATLFLCWCPLSTAPHSNLCDDNGCVNGQCVLPPTAPIPTCNCAVGFRASVIDANVCIDINECAENAYLCGGYRVGFNTFVEAGFCENLIPGYNCSVCRPGYNRSPDGLTCVAIPSNSYVPSPTGNLYRFNLLNQLDIFKK